jgi:uncharacterized protein
VDDKVFLTAAWKHLAILNYEVEPSLLASFIPRGTEPDYYDGKAFVSLVGFRFLNTKLSGYLSIPLHSNFEEVNLRFYVRRVAGNEVRRGVVFIREIVPRRAIAFVARVFYNENYVALPMAHEISSLADNSLRVTYRWRSGKAWSDLNLETGAESELPAEGSLEQFITEHYWGYASQPGGGCVEYRVTHPPWKVWPVKRSSFNGDVEKLYGKAFSALLRKDPNSAFLAEGSGISVMRGRGL